MRIVDLSQPIYQGMPVFPGHQKTVIWKDNTHEQTREKLNHLASYQTLGIMMSDHTGTHVDAFSHFNNSSAALTIDLINLVNFVTPGICLDVSFLNPGDSIDEAILREACTSSGLIIKPGSTVILYTGFQPSHDNFSSIKNISPSGIEYLHRKNVVNIGTDALSIDNKKSSFSAHQTCVDKGIMNTENLANLEQIANQSFLYVGLPLKIVGGTGSPIRSVAIFEL